MKSLGATMISKLFIIKTFIVILSKMHVVCFVKILIVFLSKKHVTFFFFKHILLLYLKKLIKINKLLSISTKT